MLFLACGRDTTCDVEWSWNVENIDTLRRVREECILQVTTNCWHSTHIRASQQRCASIDEPAAGAEIGAAADAEVGPTVGEAVGTPAGLAVCKVVAARAGPALIADDGPALVADDGPAVSDSFGAAVGPAVMAPAATCV